jgi:hypothetical protein
MNERVSAVLVLLFILCTFELTFNTQLKVYAMDNWIAVNPAHYQGSQVDELFTININISVNNLQGFEYKFRWNNTLLELEQRLPIPPWDVYYTSKNEVKDLGDGRSQHWLIVGSTSDSFNGTITICNYTFRVAYQPQHPESDGYSLLDLTDTKFLDPDAQSIPHSTYNGEYEIESKTTPPPPPPPPPPSERCFYLTPFYYKADHVGEVFQISVRVAVSLYDGHGMFGYAFKFYWNRTLINATTCEVYRPDDWSGSWADVGAGFQPEYNATHGRYFTATTALGETTPEVVGNFTLVTIVFEAIYQPFYPELGSCLLNLTDAALSGKAGYVIPIDVYPSEYEIESVVGVHDVAVTAIHIVCCDDYGVQIDKMVVCKGYTTCINVTVTCEGNCTENIYVGLWAQSVSTYKTGFTVFPISLRPRVSKTITFLFDSTALPKGNYTIFANATIVEGETDIADNTYMDSWIFVVHLGDLDMDNHVHLYDLTILGTAWNSRPGDPHWWANADIDGDCHVFLYDLTILESHWHEYAP